MKRLTILVLLYLNAVLAHAQTTDPYIWLEDPKAPAAVAWADGQNKITENALKSDPRFATAFQSIHDLVFAPTRLPSIELRAGMIYNFWQDQAHPHGYYRRTSLAEFAKPSPNWETVFDLDALAKVENANWVWQGANCLEPAFQVCLFSLSNGGQDASVVREYDLTKKAFVAGGFDLPEAKSEIQWIDTNSVFVATDFGAGSLTKSGYARILKRWRRGQPLAQAAVVMQADVSQLTVSGSAVRDENGAKIMVVTKATDYDHREVYLYSANGRLTLLPFPGDAEVHFGLNGRAFILTKSPWTVNGQTFVAGSLLSWSLDQLARGKPEVIFAPSAKTFLNSWQLNGGKIYISLLNNVEAELKRVELVKGKWVSTDIAIPRNGTVNLGLAETHESSMLFRFESFVTPSTYYSISGNAVTPQILKNAPTRFNAANFAAEQYTSMSKDGTVIPYFVVHPKNWAFNGANPTVLYGYGGFEASQTPFYSGIIGQNWLEKGGVFVLANIRGGDEFGPAWHTGVLKENRQKVFDDFISVAEDLIARKITSPQHLGIEGGSNGGLLVGATFVQRPELFNAVVCEVPLLDMIRFPRIGAGASWEAEYGDPADPTVHAAILKYSPYQNVKSGVAYPKVFFTTSRTDDRVGPAHARKMAAKMQAMGDNVLFYEDPEGGHTGSDNPDELVNSQALIYTYLYQHLMP